MGPLNIFYSALFRLVTNGGSNFINTSEDFYLSSRLGPTQTRPPCRGDGLLQERWRSSKPVPHVVLHCPHDDHGVQPPFLWQQTHGEGKKRKKRKLFHKASQTGIIIQQRSQCYSFSNGKWEGKELFGLIIRLVVILETDMQAHSELILTERHSFNLPKCFVPG